MLMFLCDSLLVTEIFVLFYQAFVESLLNDITLMATSILNKGLDLSVDLGKLPQEV